jgi:formimidoylglutamate deiminase
VLLDEHGAFLALTAAPPTGCVRMTLPGRVLIGGFINSHSHAFQRALRGRTESASTDENFWSWRDDMYGLVSRLDPDQMQIVATQAYREMLSAGYTTVKEFHYLHHQPNGRPYDDPHEMVHRLIAAAADARISLEVERVVYLNTVEAAQARFCDGDIDSALNWTADLAGAVDIKVGIAPHSIRAVSPADIAACSRWAMARGVECHSHVAEQPREVASSLEKFGRRPLAAIGDLGGLGPHFVGVHLTHLSAEEIVLAGRAGVVACVCPTTEGNLGDGVPFTSSLLSAGAGLGIGSDSNAIIDPFAELRLLEFNERNRLGRRRVLDPAALLNATTEKWTEGVVPTYLALDCSSPALLGVAADHLPGAIVMGAGPECIAGIYRGVAEVERDGLHARNEFTQRYARCVQEIFE